MSDATLGSFRVTRGRLTQPPSGVWTCDLELDGPATLAGPQVLTIAGAPCQGTIYRGGPYVGASSFRLVGGAGGWSRELPAKAYRSDVGVRLASVLKDAAREAGEQIEIGDGVDRALGAAYVRERGPAARVLELAGAWWVGLDGVTRTGPRPAPTLPASSYRVTRYEPAFRRAELATETPTAIVPGLVLPPGPELPEQLVVGGVEIELERTQVRVTVYGRSDGDRIVASLRALVRAELAAAGLHGFYEYRVQTQQAQYLSLQAIEAAVGLPDTARVEPWPGLAGGDVTVALGSTVLLGFRNGDRARPFVAFWAPQSSSGFLPAALSLDATSMRIGKSASDVSLARALGAVVREGDTISIGTASGVVAIVLGLGVPPEKSKVCA